MMILLEAKGFGGERKAAMWCRSWALTEASLHDRAVGYWGQVPKTGTGSPSLWTNCAGHLPRIESQVTTPRTAKSKTIPSPPTPIRKPGRAQNHARAALQFVPARPHRGAAQPAARRQRRIDSRRRLAPIGGPPRAPHVAAAAASRRAAAAAARGRARQQRARRHPGRTCASRPGSRPSSTRTSFVGRSAGRLLVCKWCFKYSTKVVPFVVAREGSGSFLSLARGVRCREHVC